VLGVERFDCLPVRPGSSRPCRLPWERRAKKRGRIRTGKKGVVCSIAGIEKESRKTKSMRLGAPGATRTLDLRIRSPLLYPTELQARFPLISDLLTRLSISFRSSGFPVHAETRRQNPLPSPPLSFTASVFTSALPASCFFSASNAASGCRFAGPDHSMVYCCRIKRDCVMVTSHGPRVSFRPERVLFRPGAVGPPAEISTLREAGGRRGFGGLDHRSRRSARRYPCTPPHKPLISLPVRKIPPFRIGNCKCHPVFPDGHE
jgi:hypothetical protein